MNKPVIEDYGRGPQLPSSRITVYDVMDYYLDGWPAGRIANWLSQRQDEIEARHRVHRGLPGRGGYRVQKETRTQRKGQFAGSAGANRIAPAGTRSQEGGNTSSE